MEKSQKAWPDLVEYNNLHHDLTLLPVEILRDINERMLKHFDAVVEVLKPVPGYDLPPKLQHAMRMYYFFNANKRGGYTPLQTLPSKEKEKLLNEIERRTKDYLHFVTSQKRALIDLLGNDTAYLWSSMLYALSQIENRRKALSPDKIGRPKDLAMSAFMSSLLLIYESATERRMTARTGLGGPYGPSFDFVKVCLPLVGLSLGDDAIHKWIKKTLSHAEQIRKSPILSIY